MAQTIKKKTMTKRCGGSKGTLKKRTVTQKSGRGTNVVGNGNKKVRS